MPEIAYAPDPRERPLTLVGSRGLGSAGGQEVFKGNYGGGTPTQTPNAKITAAIAYDLDPPNRVWNWNGSAWF